MWQKIKTWILELWQLFTPPKTTILEAPVPKKEAKKYFYSPKQWAKLKIRRKIAKLSRRINKK